MTGSPETALATYGTLAPGRANHGQLSHLDGSWSTGYVRGNLVQAGWGADMGYPGLILDPDGGRVEVFLFQSVALSGHWARLDAFEGTGYRRVVVSVETDAGAVAAYLYEIAN